MSFSCLDSETYIPDPCAGYTFVFNPKSPTAVQKQWLIMQVIEGVMTAKDIRTHYHISNKVVKVWVYRYKNGQSMNENIGRPRSIDKIGLASIQRWMNDTKEHINDIKALKNKINEVYSDSKRRKLNKDSINNDKMDENYKLSHGSMVNYIRMVSSNKIIKLIEERKY